MYFNNILLDLGLAQAHKKTQIQNQQLFHELGRLLAKS